MADEPARGPGWYPDANKPGSLRWWDGSGWTPHVRQPGQPPAPIGGVYASPPLAAPRRAAGKAGDAKG